MKSYYYKLVNLVFFAIMPLYCFSQNNPINGVYTGPEYERIVIENDKFKILSDRRNFEVNKNDSVIAFGSVKYHDNNFIELNSAYYNIIAMRGMVFSESQNTTIKDSLLIKFSFPFSGFYKILIIINYKRKFELINQTEIKIPINELKDYKQIGFEIFNLKPIRNNTMQDYCRISVFRFLSGIIENDHTNCISISIPNLTNSYFQYYVIKGEYARIEDDILIWRGELYYGKSW